MKTQTLTLNKLEALRNKLKSDPIFFTEKVLGKKPWSKQAEILRALKDNPRVAVRSCHGIGKTFISANAILWFLFCHCPSIVLSTAPTWRQVEKLIWKEIRASYRDSKIPLGGGMPRVTPELHIIPNEWYAAGLSTNEPDRFQGFHEEYILVVVDEAAGVSEAIFEAVEGVLTSKGARLLLLGNPTAIGGTFYQAFKSPTFAKIHVSAFDTPNFTAFGITPEDIYDGSYKLKIGDKDLPNPRLITPEWVRGRYLEWGTDSPAWSARVLGNFPSQAEDTLIPLVWVELAMERWEEAEASGEIQIGADVAAFGSDRSVIVVRHGSKIIEIKSYAKQSTMETAGLIKDLAREYGTERISVDEIGVGRGVVDALEEQGFDDVGVNVAERAYDPERFYNLRSEIWWNLRERLNPESDDPISLPPNDDLLSELASIKYKLTSRGSVQVEAKDAMKKRLGHSPDMADAICLALPRPETGGFVTSGGGLIVSDYIKYV